ncbi:probable serine/threonine-protein kinase mps1 [Drosophila ficusphila]|uniref:probable serine/threonine-protein kinase mps1 n=1 Tax=Drosophila ficusphila TaxID=30025 RepID=UPI0007E7ED15|nr:probable serine/threonine-protein kinase mps1 [Drosophila ficusphila]
MDMHRLIYEVQQRPALWDSAHPDHANRPETQRLWNAVAEATGLNVDVCRSKWKNLRCSYRRQNRRSGLLKHQQSASPGHQWVFAEALSFLDGQRLLKEDRDSSNNEEEPELESAFKAEPEPMVTTFKSEESSAAEEMEADNDALMQEFQNAATPQALRRLSQSISLASAAAEEQVAPSASLGLKVGPGISVNPNLAQGTALAAAAASSCHCAKRVDEQVNFLENLEREEQQLMQSTSQDLARCKSVLHVGDSDYNFLISFLPLMKQMTPLQNIFFRAKMSELLLQTMQQPPVQQQLQQQQQPQQLQQQQQQLQQQQPSQMLLNQQQMALDQAQVSTSSTNWN